MEKLTGRRHGGGGGGGGGGGEWGSEWGVGIGVGMVANKKTSRKPSFTRNGIRIRFRSSAFVALILLDATQSVTRFKFWGMKVSSLTFLNSSLREKHAEASRRKNTPKRHKHAP
jgi:hypothetical protein